MGVSCNRFDEGGGVTGSQSVRTWRPHHPYNPGLSTQEWGIDERKETKVDFRRRQTVPTTMATDPRGSGISRRGVLKTGLAASASLLVRPVRVGAQDATPTAGLTDEQRGWLERASRNDVNGWVHLKIEGAPFERGFQHGYLVAAEYADALRVYEAMTYQTMGFEYGFFVD